MIAASDMKAHPQRDGASNILPVMIYSSVVRNATIVAMIVE